MHFNLLVCAILSIYFFGQGFAEIPVIASEDVSVLCPNGSIEYSVSHGDCFLFVNSSQPFYIAEGYCRRAGGHLATINDSFTESFININAGMQLNSANYWIGGHVVSYENDNIWTWTRLESLMRFTNWKKGPILEPRQSSEIAFLFNLLTGIGTPPIAPRLNRLSVSYQVIY